MDSDTVRKIRPSRGASATHFTPFSDFPEPARSRRQKNFERIQACLAEEFRGITTAGVPVEGLFPVASTGLSLEPVLDAANDLRSALTNAQWAEASFAIDDRAWRAWHNMHTFLIRHGLPLHTL
ncbi:MAG: DUF3500 domain-containing protein, partial [Alphaproteobacteria bacterium]|nr:DUF3500 domain-containing protein [Alphaproteobacteria bacterium]